MLTYPTIAGCKAPKKPTRAVGFSLAYINITGIAPKFERF